MPQQRTRQTTAALAAIALAACAPKEKDTLLVPLIRNEHVDVAIGSPIINGSPLWPFDSAPRGTTVIAVRDDDNDRRFSFYIDRSSRCDHATTHITCGHVRDRVLLRLIDGHLSEMFLQGEIALASCVVAQLECTPVATSPMGNTRQVRACDFANNDIGQLRMSAGTHIDELRAIDWVAKRTHRRIQTRFTRRIFGTDIDTAKESEATCGTARRCSEWEHTVTTWHLGDYRGTEINLLEETRTLVRSGAT